jgi:hypothetical protein
VVDELVVVEQRAVALQLPLQALAHEAGEEPGPAVGHPALRLDLVDEELQEER